MSLSDESSFSFDYFAVRFNAKKTHQHRVRREMKSHREFSFEHHRNDSLTLANANTNQMDKKTIKIELARMAYAAKLPMLCVCALFAVSFANASRWPSADAWSRPKIYVILVMNWLLSNSLD